MFSCCASYLECSKQGFCIKQEKGKDCSYAAKLKDGHNFYDNDHLQRLYVLIDGQCYAVCTRNSMNMLYKPESKATALLKAEFDKLGIKYIEQYEFRLCHAEHTSDSNPAYWDVYFQIGENKFAVRNFNIRLFTQDKAHFIRSYLMEKGLNCSVVTHVDSKTLSSIKNTNKTDKPIESKPTQAEKSITRPISKPVDDPVNLPKGFSINHSTDPRWKPSDKKDKRKKTQDVVVENQIDMFGLIYGG